MLLMGICFGGGRRPAQMRARRRDDAWRAPAGKKGGVHGEIEAAQKENCQNGGLALRRKAVAELLEDRSTVEERKFAKNRRTASGGIRGVPVACEKGTAPEVALPSR